MLLEKCLVRKTGRQSGSADNSRKHRLRDEVTLLKVELFTMIKDIWTLPWVLKCPLNKSKDTYNVIFALLFRLSVLVSEFTCGVEFVQSSVCHESPTKSRTAERHCFFILPLWESSSLSVECFKSTSWSVGHCSVSAILRKKSFTES